MIVSIEYIRWLKSELAAINQADIEDIDFFEDRMRLDIPEKLRQDFELTGLNNVDFITTGFYKGIEDYGKL